MRGECYGGVDDGFFERSWRSTSLVLAVHCRIPGAGLCPAGLRATRVTVDGLDATEAIVGLVRSWGRELSLLLLDTVVFAGFNVAEPWRIYSETGVPVAVVYWYPPRREAVERALRLHFPDWRLRLGVLERVWADLRRLECPRGGLFVAPYGLGLGEAWSLVCGLQVYTRQPEPLYTAHVAASTLSRILAGGRGGQRFSASTWHVENDI